MGRRLLVVAAALVGVTVTDRGAEAQEDLPGVELGLMYANSYLPALAVQPFTGSFGGEGLAPGVEAIVGRDLRNSDRFEVMDSLPDLMVGTEVDYALWDRLNAVWLVTGAVEGAGDGYVLVVELHDVVYGEVRERGRFRLPNPTDEDFRMAVHRTSDEIVRWATGDPGMAASRIAFTMFDAEGNKDIYVIDSDGENLERPVSRASTRSMRAATTRGCCRHCVAQAITSRPPTIRTVRRWRSPSWAATRRAACSRTTSGKTVV